MDTSVEDDTIPVEYFLLTTRELKLGDNESESFHKYSEARMSHGVLKFLAIFSIPLAIYVIIMALLHAKSWYFFVAIAGGSILIRNPSVIFVLYIKSKMISGERTPFVTSSAAWIPFIQNMMAVTSSVAIGLFLIARMLNGPCKSLDQYHRYSCSSEHGADALPQEHMLGMMFLPLTLSTVFKTIKTPFIVMAWLVSVICIALCIGVFEAYQSIPAVVMYVPMSMAVLYENHRENLILFKVLRKQQTLLRDIRILSEEAQTELRFMIANMAHDLKTPLSSFMNGVEILSSLCGELSKPNADSTKLHGTIRETITNLFNVNNFMTMTINRCIDYMKASKGIKLEPRLETINLQEVLSMPLNCMRDLQSRIAIVQSPIPSNVCSHIITDLQWFQENLFCLTSNAVKYSSQGHITVSIVQVNDSDDRLVVAAARKNKDNSALSDMNSLDSHLPTVNSVVSNDYSYLDKLPAIGSDRTKAQPLTSEAKQNSFLSVASRSDVYVDVEAGATLVNNAFEEIELARPAVLRRKSTSFKEYLLVEVEDSGIGLSDEVKQTLFKPFKQAQRRAGGTGLGLYSLAKRVDALGGYYGVSNRRDGEQGSIFWFAIPYRPDEVSARNDTVRSCGLGRSPVSLKDEKPFLATSQMDSAASTTAGNLSSHSVTNHSPQIQESAAKLPDSAKLRILLVDDSVTILKMTSNLLKRHGHVVDQEENGADALKALEKISSEGAKYDIVLMDLNMPVMDGLEAMKRLREVEKQLSESSGGGGDGVGGVSYHQKVFAFTANSDNETRQEALDAGADDFISKPFSIQTFNEKVGRLSVSL